MSVECLIPAPPARMEQLPGLDTVARMEQLPGWNNYLGSNLRPQTTRAVTLPIELRGASTRVCERVCVCVSVSVGECV